MRSLNEYCEQVLSIDEYVMQSSNVHPTQLDEYVMQSSNFHLAQLNEYLSTKPSDVDILDYNEIMFPTDMEANSIIEFLDSHGFKRIYLPEGEQTFIEISESLEKSKHPAYIVGPFVGNIYSHWIVFSKGGTISEENPVFFIRTNKNVEPTEKYTVWFERLKYGNLSQSMKSIMDDKEFICLINKSLSSI